jgi:hypothetical protein
MIDQEMERIATEVGDRIWDEFESGLKKWNPPDRPPEGWTKEGFLASLEAEEKA